MLSKREIDRRIRFRHNHSRVIMSHLHNLLPNYFRVRKWIQQYFRVRKWIHPAFSSAFETEEDKQGRILLPQELKTYAGITKNIVTIGVGSRIEIWAEEAFNAYTKDTNFATESAKLSEYGI